MQKNTILKSTTPRQPIKKITQIDTLDEQKHLLHLFSSCKYSAIEKIDGFAFRVAVIKSDIYFESAYSGYVKAEQFFIKSIAKSFEKNSNIIGISDKPIKFVGELLVNRGLDEDNTFTPVCTKYTINPGADMIFVIFDAYYLEDDKLIKISDSELSSYILTLNVLSEKINYVNGKTLKYTFSNINVKNGFNELVNSIVKEIDTFKSNLNDSSVFSPIEGVVFNFENGETYGAFSSKYKEQKYEYYALFNKAEEELKKFKKAVYQGYCQNTAIIKKGLHTTINANNLYLFLKPQVEDNLRDIARDIKHNLEIPLSLRKMQYELIIKKLDKIFYSTALTYVL